MRIVVAMSGGVDSSVAAALLAEQGHEVIGLSMQLYDHSAGSEGEVSFGSCCTLDDLYDARRVAAAINVPHYIVNFERQFNETVVSNFVQEYAAGRTPLPCARCNSDLKFATLVDRASALGADAVATGHYARVEHHPGINRFLLKRGVDRSKDQSYFLFSLTQDQLARALFPVGDRPKNAVREYARMRQLPVADKADSQEICFIPDNDYARFIDAQSRRPDEGTIVDGDGRVLGRHEGIHRFTIGQRKGLHVAPTSADSQRLYVIELRPAERQVVVGPHQALERTALTASGVNWIVERPEASLRVQAQIRYRHPAAAATVTALDGGRVSVSFDAPQAAIAPGQAVVFYDGDVVVGGGWID